MKRVVYVVLGVLSLLLGLLVAAGGGAVAVLLGSDESISAQPARAKGSGVALVAENIRVDESSVPVPTGVGSLTLVVTSPGGGAMFAGTAKPDDLDEYLAGAPYDVVVDLSSGQQAKTRPVPGTQQPAAPGGQTFWTAQATGTSATLRTDLDPSTALVVMNADGSPGVDADLVVTYRLKGAWIGSWVAVGVGALLVLVAILFFWRARAARRRRDAARAAEALATAPAAGTVLPGAPAAEPSVPLPAWAAAPTALEAEGLAGPPTGALVVEPAADGTAAVVSSTAAPAAAPPVPEAGWYPGAAVPAAAAAAAAVDPDPTEPGAAHPADAADPVDAADPAGSDVSDAADVDGTEQDEAAAVDGPEPEAVAANNAERGTGEPEQADEPGAAPDVAVTDDAVDTWHDDTVEIPVSTPAPAVDVPAGDDPLYEELSSWFRDDPGPGEGR